MKWYDLIFFLNVDNLHEGWYRDRCWYNELTEPSHLQHTNIKYVDKEVCEKERDSFSVSIDESVICTAMVIDDGSAESRACRGDSGGGLVKSAFLSFSILRTPPQ